MTGPATAAEAIDSAVGSGVVPGAVLAAGLRSAEPLLLHVAGDAQHDDAARRPMTADTVFDLASLTKVVATGWRPGDDSKLRTTGHEGRRAGWRPGSRRASARSARRPSVAR
jgi:hypothetical protein